MKPAIFDYYRAETLDHASELLSRYGDDAKILAGGQSLIAAMNYRLARPAVLIDVGGIEKKNEISFEGDQVRVKATTTQRITEKNETVVKELPMLVAAIENIAHYQIRNRGTVGGSIVNADPASELPAMTLILDAELEVKNLSGRRTIPADEFFITYMTTSMEADEVLMSILFKTPPATSGWGFHEVTRRAGDFAMVGSGAVVNIDDEGKCCYSRVVVFGASETPVRATPVEDILMGEKCTPDLVREAAEQVLGIIEPESDVHVSEDYRKKAAVTLTARAIQDGFKKAELKK